MEERMSEYSEEELRETLSHWQRRWETPGAPYKFLLWVVEDDEPPPDLEDESQAVRLEYHSADIRTVMETWASTWNAAHDYHLSAEKGSVTVWVRPSLFGASEAWNRRNVKQYRIHAEHVVQYVSEEVPGAKAP